MRASYIRFVVIMLLLTSSRRGSAQEAPEPRFGWAYAIGSPAIEASRALAWSPSGRVACAGVLASSEGRWVDFDPGPGEDLFRATGYEYDIYITHYKETGEYEWTRVIGGELHESPQGVALDDEGSVYVAGAFGDYLGESRDYRLDVDPGPRVHYVYAREYGDALLVKLDRHGRYAWSYTVGGGGGIVTPPWPWPPIPGATPSICWENFRDRLISAQARWRISMTACEGRICF